MVPCLIPNLIGHIRLGAQVVLRGVDVIVVAVAVVRGRGVRRPERRRDDGHSGGDGARREHVHVDPPLGVVPRKRTCGMGESGQKFETIPN